MYSIKAIVYKSNTGFTEKYAKLLSDNTGLPCYTVTQAAKTLNKNDEIIYMGWVCAGIVSGLSGVTKNFTVKAVCAVGMSSPSNENNTQITKANNICDTEFFYLQGGFNYNKLHGLNKLLIKVMRPILIKQLSNKKDDNSSLEVLNALQNGGDFVREINLKEIIVWYHKTK